MVSRSRGLRKKSSRRALRRLRELFFFARVPAVSAFLLFFVIDTVRGLLFHKGF